MRFETLIEQLFFVTVRIVTRHADGSERSGTGFLYAISTSPNEDVIFLITNKHVVAGAEQAEVFFMAARDPAMSAPLLGTHRAVRLDKPDAMFLGHPDPAVDVAAIPVSPWIRELNNTGNGVFYRALAPAIALTEEKGLELDAMEDIVFVGYPLGLYDKSSGLPIARRGVTASPLELDYEGKPQFLVDASVFPGSSGSPVLIAQSGGYSPRGGGIAMGTRVIWLGVMAAVYNHIVEVEELPTSLQSIVKDPSNLGIVYKASTVDELCDLLLSSHGLQRYSAAPSDEVTSPDAEADPLVES